MNAKKREYIVGMVTERRILMRHEESEGNRETIAFMCAPYAPDRCSTSSDVVS